MSGDARACRRVQDLKAKPYDFFDHTKDTFDADFAHFGKQVADVESSLKNFVEASFEETQVRSSAPSSGVCGCLAAALAWRVHISSCGSRTR
jgi:hypothetical protein